MDPYSMLRASIEQVAKANFPDSWEECYIANAATTLAAEGYTSLREVPHRELYTVLHENGIVR